LLAVCVTASGIAGTYGGLYVPESQRCVQEIRSANCWDPLGKGAEWAGQYGLYSEDGKSIGCL